MVVLSRVATLATRGVTLENYKDAARAITAYIRELQATDGSSVTSSILGVVGATPELRLGSGSAVPPEDCEDAQGDAEVSWGNASWTASPGEVGTYAVIADTFGLDWEVTLSARRGRIEFSGADDYQFTVYLRVEAVITGTGASHHANMPVDGDDKWHSYLSFAGSGTHTSPVLAGEQPEWVGPCQDWSSAWTIESVYVAKHPIFDASADGNCGGCGSCGGAQCVSGEEVTHDVDSVSSRFGLGSLDSEQSAGNLMIHQERPDTDLYTPKLLELVIDDSIDTAGTNIIKSGGVLRQVWTGNRLIDILTNAEDSNIAADSYEMRYYQDDQIEATQVSGLWVVKTSEDPYRTVVVSKPAGTSGGENLRMTELDDGGDAVKVVEYFWDDMDDFWTLAEGLDTTTPDLAGAVRRESFEEEVDGDTRTETRKVLSGDGLTTLSHVEETYTQYPFGWVMTKRVIDPVTAKLTWMWDYYTQPGDDGYGQLRSFVSKSGYWEHYVYDSDGVLTQKIMQLDDNTYDGTNATTLASNNRVVAYSQTAGTLVGTTEDVFVQVTTMKVLDDVVGASYEVYRGVTAVTDTHEVWQLRCATDDPELGNGTLNFIKHMVAGTDNGGDLYASAGHLVSRSWRYDGGHDDEYKTARSLSPAGQVSLHNYSGGNVVVMERGFADDPLAATPVMEYGTRTTSTTDSMGNFVSSHAERVVQGESYFTVSFTEGVVVDDLFGRPQQMKYYFGAEAEARSNGNAAAESYITSRTYDGCCGTVGFTSTTNRQGITTQSHYDDLGRVYKTVSADGTTNGEIHNLRVFDALGRSVHRGLDGEVQSNGNDGVLERTDPEDIVTSVTYDAAGRMVSSENPEGRMSYRAYRRVKVDGDDFDIDTDTGVFYWETRSYGHDDNAPISVSWTDSHGATVFSAVCSITSAVWPPAANATLTVHRQSVSVDRWIEEPEASGEYQHERLSYAYHNLSNVQGQWMELDDPTDDVPGEVGTDYLIVSKVEMDALGRAYRQTDTLGNISEPIFESGTGRTLGTQVGIDTAAMLVVNRVFYREFEAGNDANSPAGDWRPYVTRSYSVRPGLTTAPAEDAAMTDYTYVENTESFTLVGGALSRHTRWSKPSAAGVPWSRSVTDEQGRAIDQGQYQHGSTTYALSNQQTSFTASGQVDYVDVRRTDGSGTILDDYLRTEFGYDDAGRQVWTFSAGRGISKVEFDAYGRTLRGVTVSAEGTNTDIYGADTFTDDIILSEIVYTYNLAGEVLYTTSYARAHDAPGTTTGLLSAAAANQSRVSYSAVWRDDNGRTTHQAAYGTNGGAAFTRPPVAPELPNTSDDWLVSQTEYDDAGVPYLTTANDGRQTRIYTNDAGRRTFIVEGYDATKLTGGNPATPANREADVNRVTQYVYDYSNTIAGGGQMIAMTAIDPNADGTLTDNQTTFYINSGEIDAAKRGDIPVNGRPVAVLYPDAEEDGTSRANVITAINGGTAGDFVYTEFYAAGDTLRSTDQRGVQWTNVYTTAGQLDYRYYTGTWTVPADTDQRFEYGYGDAGELLSITAFDVAAGGAANRTSSVDYEYDGFYNRVSETQNHAPAAVGPKAQRLGEVQYAYDTTQTGDLYTNAHRLDTITYPNGRVIELVYDGHNGIDTAISRANGIDEVIAGVSTDVTRYEYLGTSALVRKDYTIAEVRLDFTDETGEGSIANDGYDESFDRFGRPLRYQWESYDGSGDGETDLFHNALAYDRAGNRRYEQRIDAPGYALAYRHDNLGRIIGTDRGPLVLDGQGDVDLTSGAAEVDEFWQLTGRDWHLDQLGNQTSIDTESSNARFTNTTNRGNEITARSSDSTAMTDENRNDFSSAADPNDSDIFTAFINCTSGNLDLTTSSGNLMVTTGTVAAPAVIITGEAFGPLPTETSFQVPTGTTSGLVGLVFGYQSDLDYWVFAKNYTTGDGDWGDLPHPRRQQQRQHQLLRLRRKTIHRPVQHQRHRHHPNLLYPRHAPLGRHPQRHHRRDAGLY